MAIVETNTAGGGSEARYLIFRLAGEEYGVPVLKVQEIIQWVEVTRVPRVPEFIRGVVNLRGRVIPVLDLRTRFGLPPEGPSARTCMVVLQIRREGGLMPAAAIVDEVIEVIDLPPSSIVPPPDLGTRVETSFIAGIGQAGRRVILILNVEKILDNRDWAAVEGVANVRKEQEHE